MCDVSKIVKQRQIAIRREMDRRGLLLKVVSFDSGIPYSTLASYFPADKKADPTQMPTGVLYALCGHMPDDLLSLMLPAGRMIVQVPQEIDHDSLAEAVTDYLHTKNAAHHPDSPAGPAISECERDLLNEKVVSLPLVGKVA